jgi:hypothetical protein
MQHDVKVALGSGTKPEPPRGAATPAPRTKFANLDKVGHCRHDKQTNVEEGDCGHRARPTRNN